MCRPFRAAHLSFLSCPLKVLEKNKEWLYTRNDEPDKVVDSFMLMKKFWMTFAQLFCASIFGCARLSGTVLLNQLSPTSEYEPKTMDFDTAVGNTMGKSLSLSIAQDHIQVKQGEMVNAGRYPNPTHHL